MHTEKAIELDNRHIPIEPYGKKLYKPKALCTQLTTQLPQFLIILKKKKKKSWNAKAFEYPNAIQWKSMHKQPHDPSNYTHSFKFLLCEQILHNSLPCCTTIIHLCKLQ